MKSKLVKTMWRIAAFVWSITFALLAGYIYFNLEKSCLVFYGISMCVYVMVFLLSYSIYGVFPKLSK